MQSKQKPQAKIENWFRGEYDLLYGEVYGHPKLPDGAFIRTSSVIKFDPNTKEAETLNTVYKLGKPKE